jgi:hypothetical protein
MFASSYSSDPVMNLLLKGMDTQRRSEVLRRMFVEVVSIARRHGRVICSLENGALLGAGVFYPPRRFPPWYATLPSLGRLVSAMGVTRVLSLAKLGLLSNPPTLPSALYYHCTFNCVDTRERVWPARSSST